MENLAHTLTGVVLARTGLGGRVPFGTATLVIAANLPDLDIVVSAKGPLFYLHYHRGITHSLLGSLLMGFGLTLIIWFLRRWSKPVPYKFPQVLGVVTLTSLTHPLLDYTNSYGLRPYLPFSDLRFFGDLVFIIDPYLWVILGAAAFLTADRTRFSRVVWAVGILMVLLLLGLFSTFESAGVVALTATLAAIIAVIYLKRTYGIQRQSIALLSLGIVGVYWALLAICHHLALDSGKSAVIERFPERQFSEISALPKPANPFSWDLMFQDHETVYHGVASSLKEERIAFAKYERNLELPEVRVALATCPGSVFSYFSRFDFFEVNSDSEGPTVIMRDPRFSRAGNTGFGVLRLELTDDLKLKDRIPCPAFELEEASSNLSR